MGFAAIATAAVVAYLLASGGSSEIKLAAAAGIYRPPAPQVPFLTPASGGQSFVLRGSRYTVLAPSAGTGGAFSVLRIDLRHGSEPPPHIHHREAEAFYLLGGTMTFNAGTQSLRAGAGDLVYLPRGVLHHYQVSSGTAQVLLLGVPGGLDRFFAALAANPNLATQTSRQYGVQPVPSQSAAPATTSGALAPFLIPAAGGAKVTLRGSPYTIKADTKSTGGAFALLDVGLHHGSEPPAHIHHHEAEVFYLLSGTMTFFPGTAAPVNARAGDLVFLARGLQHRYQVTSGSAHVLLLAVPSGLEQFFRLSGQNPKLLQTLGKQYGIQPGAAATGK